MEENIKTKTYEGMFLLDGGQPNFELACEPIRNVMERSNGEVLSIRLWEDRKLAYEIKGRKRGIYVLTYFKMDVDKVVELEHDCQLNEGILRVIILRKDNLTEDAMNAPTPAMLETTTREHEAAPVADAKPADAAAKDPADAAVEAPAKAPVAEAVVEAPVEAPVAEAPAEEAPVAEAAEEKAAE